MKVEELLKLAISEDLIDMVISGQKQKNQANLPTKIKIRPVKIKDMIEYQATQYIGTKVIHTNHGKAEITQNIMDWLNNDFRQAQIMLVDATAQILVGKNGSMTIKYKKSQQIREQKDISHNRQKRYILEEGKPVDFLIDLGVMSKEGKIIQHKYDKFRQINRFMEFIEDILPALDKDKEQTIIDFGCGKSYLTFAMYYYLRELKGYDIRIIGLDLKEDVIRNCNQLRSKYGYDKLNFYVGDIASYTDVDAVDMVVTLHACDTATDYALAKAVNWGAKVILSVPCCQHEANKMMKNEMFSPVFEYGILKERMAAIMTDAVRAQLLESQGYRTQILEFIDMEHTPKNLLIRAIRTDKPDRQAGKKVLELEQMFSLDLTLNRLLSQHGQIEQTQKPSCQ